jgi:hypothetical protein
MCATSKRTNVKIWTQVLTLCGHMTFVLKHRGRNPPPPFDDYYLSFQHLLRLCELCLLFPKVGVDIIQTHAHCCYLHLIWFLTNGYA